MRLSALCAVLLGCSSTTSSSPLDAGADGATQEDTAVDARTETAAPKGCTVDSKWSFEKLGEGVQNAMAVGPDGRVHALVRSGTALNYFVRSGIGVWSAAERSTASASYPDFIKMVVDSRGRVSAIGRGSSTYVERSETGTWVAESVAGFGANFTPGLTIDNFNVKHASYGSGSGRVPIYARRDGDLGPWKTVELPVAMKGAETTDVAIVSGKVVVCAIVSPQVLCTEGDGTTFAEPKSVSRDQSRLHLFSTHLAMIQDVATRAEVSVSRRAGTEWTHAGADSAPGIWTGSDGAVDKSGALHLVQTLLHTQDGDKVALRYTHFAASGTVTSETLACDAVGFPNIEILVDGRPVVSYARTDGSVYVGLRLSK